MQPGLYLVRHGQTDLNRDKRFRGMTDAPLNQVGREQAWGAGEILAGSGIKSIYTSPLPRAVETAELIASATGATVIPDHDFVDIDYGDWQGLTVEEVEERYGPEQMESWVADPGAFRFPGGDSMADVLARVGPALRRIVGEEYPGPAAAVSHLAVLKTCFLAALDLGFGWFWKVVIENGSVGSFLYAGDDGFTLESWNLTL
jgi:broad specificity phosphatase PhoE